MTRNQLIAQIHEKQSFLCVGLDTAINKLPAHLPKSTEGVLTFNKAIIAATSKYAVAYKLNTAFYEAMGPDGWKVLELTRAAIPKDILTIADAKRGDIGNTADQYAQTFFKTYPFDAVTVAPYMGSDSVQPFLAYEDKWTILLGLTSNAGSQDFQKQKVGEVFLFEKVMETACEWGSINNLMFVVGATQAEELSNIRKMIPDHFLLIPGVGAQGGDVDTVCGSAMNADGGVLINVSRGIQYASNGQDFAEKAAVAAEKYQLQMAVWVKQMGNT